MEEIIALLQTNPKEAISKMAENTKDRIKILQLREEYNDVNRNLRPSHVGRIQQDKWIGEGERAKFVRAVKIPFPFQNKIVMTGTAFEVGEPVTLVPYIDSETVQKNKISKEIERLWKVNRIDSILQDAISKKKSELQCAVLFYIKDIGEQSMINRLIGVNPKRDIKIDLLKNEDGVMTPYFDSFGNMEGFMWQFTVKKSGKTRNFAWIYTDKLLYKVEEEDNGTAKVEKTNHGFNKIPVVYFSQPYPEWHIIREMIDRYEVAMSKLGASNDYSGHPILMLYGEVLNAPDKDEDGKALRFNIKEDDDTGKIKHGDAKFLTHDNAPESVGLELEKLEKFIYSLSSTPDLSLENLKGIGDISGKAIRLMFMDAIIKAKMNEGSNRTSIERIISVFMSGLVTTVSPNLKSEAEKTYFDVKFNSILPNDLTEDILTYVQAVNAKILSQREAIKVMGIAENVDRELEEIRKESAERQESEIALQRATQKPSPNEVKPNNQKQ